MAFPELTGVNAAYVASLLQDYLDAPSSVPPEWRELFEKNGLDVAAALAVAGTTATPENGAARPAESDVANAAAPPPVTPPAPIEPSPTPPAAERPAPTTHPAVEAPAPPPPVPLAPAPPAPPPAPMLPGLAADEYVLGAVAAAMALVKAIRMHGHLAARLDPLGSEPMGDPALDESRLVPPLTPELQARHPGSPAPALRPRRDPARGAASPPRDLLGLDRLRDRAHLRPRRARLAAAGDRVRALPAAARAGEQRGAPPAALPGRGLRAVPPALVPRSEAVLARGPRRR